MTDTRASPKQSAPVLDLKHEVICDQCNKSRAHGKHAACSKARQALYANLREISK